MIKLSYEVFSELVEITKRGKPNEASALLFKNNTLVIETTQKTQNSVGSFTITDYQFIADLITEHGIPSSIFHSHPCEAFVSSTDLRFMKTTVAIWGCRWLIMSDKYILKCFNYKGCCGSSEEEVRILD